MTIAIVMSGGGSRGDFQIGALRALTDRGIEPEIVCGTSVGAINATMLTQKDGLDRLEAIWLGLFSNQEMWEFESWWQQIARDIRMPVQDWLNGLSLVPEFEDLSDNLALLGLATALTGGVAAIPVAFNYASQISFAVQTILHRARAIMNLNPIERMFGREFNKGEFDSWVAKGKKLRLAACDLNSGCPVIFDERGVARLRDGSELERGFTIPQAAVASSSIGTIFPPVGQQILRAEGAKPGQNPGQYVDGGHRENIPIQAAIEAGAKEIYVISAGPLNRNGGLNNTEHGLTNPDYRRKGLIEIAQRALLDMPLSEVAENDVFGTMAQHPGVTITLIAPVFPIHDILTIDPDFVRANRDYGYRRTLDVLDGLDGTPDSENSDQAALAEGAAALVRRENLRIGHQPGTAAAGARAFESDARNFANAWRGGQIAVPSRIQPKLMRSKMAAGDRLLVGQGLLSGDGKVELKFNADGSVTVESGRAILWTVGRAFPDPYALVLGRDGSLRAINRSDLQSPNPALETQPIGEQAILYLRDNADVEIISGRTSNILTLSARNPGGTLIPAQARATIRNSSLIPANVEFADLTASGSRGRPVGMTGVTLQPDEEMDIPLPRGFGGVQSWWNERHCFDLISGDTVDFDLEDRIFITNSSRSRRGVVVEFRETGIPATSVTLGQNARAVHLPTAWNEVEVVIDNRSIGKLSAGAFYNYSRETEIILQSDEPSISVQFLCFDERDSLHSISLKPDLPPCGTGAQVIFKNPKGDPKTQVAVFNGIWLRHSQVISAGDAYRYDFTNGFRPI